jgi:hypothetical protein
MKRLDYKVWVSCYVPDDTNDKEMADLHDLRSGVVEEVIKKVVAGKIGHWSIAEVQTVDVE